MLFIRKVKVSDTAGRFFTATREAHLNYSLLFINYMTNGKQKKPDLLNKIVHGL